MTLYNRVGGGKIPRRVSSPSPGVGSDRLATFQAVGSAGKRQDAFRCTAVAVVVLERWLERPKALA